MVECSVFMVGIITHDSGKYASQLYQGPFGGIRVRVDWRLVVVCALVCLVWVGCSAQKARKKAYGALEG